MIHFSAPLPFDNRQIQMLHQINEQHKEAQIDALYNCLPLNASDKSEYEQLRCIDTRVNSLSDLVEYVNYAKSLGMKFTYLLNTVNTPNQKEFRDNEGLFRCFLEKLLNNDIRSLRVSNTQITGFISNNYPEFELCGSTSQEYYSMKQYINYLTFFPNVKSVVLSWDINKNFELIRNFTSLFPAVEVELMVNEGCIGGCPFRHDHHSMNTGAHGLNAYFFNKACSFLSNMSKSEYLCLCNIIYPWEINTYVKYGITHFKFVGRNSPDFLSSDRYVIRFGKYMDGIENIQSISDMPITEFNNYLLEYDGFKKITVSDVLSYLPSIHYFEKNGHLCSSKCGCTCRYCYECASKLADYLAIKMT